MRDGKIALSGGIATQPRGVLVRIADKAERDKADSLLQALSQPIGGPLAGGNGRTLDVTETDSGVQLTLTDAATADKVRHAVTQSIEVLNRRINAMGTKETVIAQQGLNRVLIEVPRTPGHHQAQGDHRPDRQARLPARRRPRRPAERGRDAADAEGRRDHQRCRSASWLTGRIWSTRSRASTSRAASPTSPSASTFAADRKFGQVTTENVGRPFAIVLDGKVISAPVIRSPITGGTGQITGNFTLDEASSLAILLRAGALPAKLTVVEERTVGPGLGQDSIDAGKRASFVGAALVVVYMIATYGIFGIFADLALGVHILLIFASMVLLGATLTLPGIAGIVFTIGMAVDSNVLIYERIREEAHLGRSVISALDAGFKRAFATIVDSNVTMFVAALILYLFGSGAVRGFAVSLGLGIITSIITAVTMTRMMIALWYRRVRPTKIPI